MLQFSSIDTSWDHGWLVLSLLPLHAFILKYLHNLRYCLTLSDLLSQYCCHFIYLIINLCVCVFIYINFFFLQNFHFLGYIFMEMELSSSDCPCWFTWSWSLFLVLMVHISCKFLWQYRVTIIHQYRIQKEPKHLTPFSWNATTFKMQCWKTVNSEPWHNKATLSGKCRIIFRILMRFSTFNHGGTY